VDLRHRAADLRLQDVDSRLGADVDESAAALGDDLVSDELLDVVGYVPTTSSTSAMLARPRIAFLGRDRWSCAQKIPRCDPQR
jgi:hypothetical protein